MSASPRAQQPMPLRAAIWACVLLWSGSYSLPSVPLGLIAVLVAAPFARPIKAARVPVHFGLCAALLMGYGLVVFLVGPCIEGVLRVLFSVLLFVAAMAALQRLAASAKPQLPLLSLAEVRRLVVLIVAGAAIEYLWKWRLMGAGSELRVGGWYAEPSHLALSAAPLLMVLWRHAERHDRLIVACATLALLAMSASSTLVLLLSLLFGLDALTRLFRSGQRSSALLGMIGLGIAAAAYLLSDRAVDTVERMQGVVELGEESNLSSLVYANGWELLREYLASSSNLGLGWNAMGCQPRAFTLPMVFLSYNDMDELNATDGSFLLSKLGSELGFVGILVWLVFLGLTLFNRLARRHGMLPVSMDICYAWLGMVSIAGLVRSGGYFTGPTLLALLAAMVMTTQIRWWRRLRRRRRRAWALAASGGQRT